MTDTTQVLTPLFCIACGKQDTLAPVPTPPNEEDPFLERGVYDGETYTQEQTVKVLACRACHKEMIIL
jgi:hypothetical protein